MNLGPVTERLLEVIAEHLFHLCRPVARGALQPVCEALMEFGAHLLRQAVVGSIPDQHVTEAERVIAPEERALLADQLLAQQSPKRH